MVETAEPWCWELAGMRTKEELLHLRLASSPPSTRLGLQQLPHLTEPRRTPQLPNTDTPGYSRPW